MSVATRKVLQRQEPRGGSGEAPIPVFHHPQGLSPFTVLQGRESGWLRRDASLAETRLACGKDSVGAEVTEKADADVPILPAHPPAGCRALRLSETPVAIGLVLLEEAEVPLLLLWAISIKHIQFSTEEATGQTPAWTTPLPSSASSDNS